MHCGKPLVQAPRLPWRAVWSHHRFGKFAWRMYFCLLFLREDLKASILALYDDTRLWRPTSAPLVRTSSAFLIHSQRPRPLWTNTIPVHPPPEPEPCSIPIARPPILLKPVRSPDKAVRVAGIYKFDTLSPVQHRSGLIVSFIAPSRTPVFGLTMPTPESPYLPFF